MISPQSITLYELISLVTSIAGFITIVVSIHLLNKTLKGSTYEASADQMFNQDRLFITYPELRPYFYSGKDISEDDPNYERVMAMAEYFQDFIGSILIQHERFPQVWPENWWRPYFKHIFANSPVLCRYLESTSGWYQEELIKLMEEGKALRQEKSTLRTPVEERSQIIVLEKNEAL